MKNNQIPLAAGYHRVATSKQLTQRKEYTGNLSSERNIAKKYNQIPLGYFRVATYKQFTQRENHPGLKSGLNKKKGEKHLSPGRRTH